MAYRSFPAYDPITWKIIPCMFEKLESELELHVIYKCDGDMMFMQIPKL